MALECIIFDCDGVILESVDAKNQAFVRVCSDIDPAFCGLFQAFTELHGGMSRTEKFAWLIREIHGREITAEEMRGLCEKFVRYCREAVLASPLVPGFEDTAKRWLGKTPMYVASGTPHYELVEILEARGLDRYFAGILGTPPAKAALLVNILRDAGANPNATVMVGDSKTDADAALIAGTKFYGRGPFFAGKPCPNGPDLTGLNAFLERLALE